MLRESIPEESGHRPSNQNRYLLPLRDQSYAAGGTGTAYTLVQFLRRAAAQPQDVSRRRKTPPPAITHQPRAAKPAYVKAPKPVKKSKKRKGFLKRFAEEAFDLVEDAVDLVEDIFD